MKSKFILPGEYFVSEEPHLVTTVLGTCVSVCIYNHHNHMAAMNHFIHPLSEDGNKSEVGVYGDTSTRHIIEQLFVIDNNPSNYSAVLLGGGMNNSKTNHHFGISAANIKSGISILNEYRIRIKDTNTASNGGLKVTFDTSNNHIKTTPLPCNTVEEKNFKVLIVEDSPTYGKLLKSAIESNSSFKVIHISGNIYDARKSLVNDRPDCMTLDLKLPGMDGIELLSSVMKHFPLPVVVISGICRNFSEIKKTCLSLGAAAVLNKEAINLESETRKEISSQLLSNTMFNAILRSSK